MRKKKDERKTPQGEGFPYCANPTAQAFHGVPEGCFDIVNMYGTYEVQRTADTENEFPRIAHGTPEAEKDKVITKEDLQEDR